MICKGQCLRHAWQTCRYVPSEQTGQFLQFQPHTPAWEVITVLLYPGSDLEPTALISGLIPKWLSGKKPTCQCRRRGFHPWVRKIPWRRKWQPTPVSCLENPMDREEAGGLQPMESQRVRHDRAMEHTRAAPTSLPLWIWVYYFCLVAKSCLTGLQLDGLWPARLLCPWDPGLSVKGG